jgi:acyl carrier protein|tara:strand:+ start:982 stop:1212 length:231 start_codon:yes stop_codon:yes gene_type:complete
MKIDNKKISNIIKKIFKINKVTNLDNLKIGSLKNWDSLGNFNLLLEIEKEFKIKLSNTDFTTIKSVKELKKILKKY